MYHNYVVRRNSGWCMCEQFVVSEPMLTLFNPLNWILKKPTMRWLMHNIS